VDGHEVADAPSLDPAEFAQDDLLRRDPDRRPIPKRFEVLQDRVEALREVRNSVIVTMRLSMMGM
jgi:hypothetical protein